MRRILSGKRVTRYAWLLAALVLPCLPAGGAQARAMQARIAKVTTPVATLQGVTVRLDWAANAPTGQLHLQARQADAADLGYRWRDLEWRCNLQRDGQGGWGCEGDIRARSGPGLRLDVALGAATTEASLSRGPAKLSLNRSVATPNLSRIELAQVPVAWAQALLNTAWADAAMKAGVLDGHVDVRAAPDRPLHINGTLATAGLALETPDASVAAEEVAGRFRFDVRMPGDATLVSVDGQLQQGDALLGGTFVSLAGAPVSVAIDAVGREGRGWEFPRFAWSDPGALSATVSMALSPQAELTDLQLQARSPNLATLAPRYLSGQLALAGLSDVRLAGAAGLSLSMHDRALAQATLELHQVSLRDAQDRFGFEGLDGGIRHVPSGQADSLLTWQGGTIFGLPFGAASLPLRSAEGELASRAPVVVSMSGGTVGFDALRIRPPSGDAGLDIRFGMELDAIDFGQVAKATGLPEFQGQLFGRIPQAHYANERLDFDGGLSMQLFDGHVQVSALSMERPFGAAPSLNADIAFDDLDLLRLTEVLDFGSIDGRLDGRMTGLRLVDWTPVAFDVELQTDADAARRKGTKQRISQRAVQNISSVGDASFATSLQGRLIALFDDFGYAKIGIGCRLANEVCRMSGVAGASGKGSGDDAFTIVQGKGLPRLDVVGHNAVVDWQTLVERLAAVGKGESKPVFD